MSVLGNTTLSFSEEQAMLLDVAREFCRDKSPIAQCARNWKPTTGFDPALWDEMVALGWAGIAPAGILRRLRAGHRCAGAGG